MRIFSSRNEDEEQREIRSRTVFGPEGEREVGRPVEFSLVAREQERLVKTYPGGVEEIEKRGDSRHYFRYGGLEFLNLFSAVKMALSNLLSASMYVEEVKLEGEIRPKLQDEMLREIESQIKPLEEALVAKLTKTLLEPGPCRETVISNTELTAWQKKEHVEQENEDLRDRLSSVFGDDFNLLLTYWLRPEIFKRVVENLPEGKTESELLVERQESARRDLERHRGRIQEVRDFLKKLK